MRKLDIKEMSLQFRKAIESAIENKESGDYFRLFPKGQCGNTCYLLAQYLIDNGISPVFYVWGFYSGDTFDSRMSHAWLEVDGQVIDITGDQFQNHKKSLKNNIPVYVGKINSFYKLFDTCNGKRHELFGFEPEWKYCRDLKETYHTILKYLNR